MFELKTFSQQERLFKAYNQEFMISPEESKEFLLIQTTSAEIMFLKLADLKKKEENQCGFTMAFRESSFVTITAKDILGKCIDHINHIEENIKLHIEGSSRSLLVSSRVSGTSVASMNTQGRRNTSKQKTATFESFMSSTINFSAFDFDIGLILFYNSEGMVAIVNLLTMVRKFILLGFQGHINNILIIERNN